MAIHDRNQGPRIARNKRAEETWPENLRHLCQYFEGMKYPEVEKRLFKTPKDATVLLHDVRLKAIQMGYMGTGPEFEEEIATLARTFVEHYKLEDLVYNCIDAYEGIVRRLALMAAFEEEERRFEDAYGVEFCAPSDPPKISSESKVASGMALLGTVVKDSRRAGPPQARSDVANAAAEATAHH